MKFFLIIVFIGIVCTYGYVHHETHAEFEAAMKSFSEAKKQSKKLGNEIESVTKKLKSSKSELDNITKELAKKKSDQAALLRDDRLVEKIESTEEKSKDLFITREQKLDQLARLNDQKKTVSIMLRDAEAKHQELESNANKLIRDYDKQTEKNIKQWQAEASRNSNNSLQRQKALRECNEKIDALKASVFRAKKKLSDDVDDSKTKLSTLSRDCRAKIAAIDARIEKVRSMSLDNGGKEEKSTDSSELLSTKIDEMRRKLDREYEPKLNKLRREVETLSTKKAGYEKEFETINQDSSTMMKDATERRDQNMSRVSWGCGIAFVFVGLMTVYSFANDRRKG